MARVLIFGGFILGEMFSFYKVRGTKKPNGTALRLSNFYRTCKMYLLITIPIIVISTSHFTDVATGT